MTSRLALFASFLLLTASPPAAFSAHTVKLVSSPAVSPDGKHVAFSWREDIWIVPVGGGQAKPLTAHEAADRQPIFSPDGERIAFISNREGSNQVYIMPSSGGEANRLTFHTQGYSLQQWYPDGESILTRGARDHFWRNGERFFTIRTKPQTGETLLFDAHGHDAAISPDGKSVLFVREGTRWWRKGYRGSQAGQIWLYTIGEQKFRKIAEHPTGCRYPMWDPSGDQFYYVSGKEGGVFNLWRRKLDAEPAKARQLTEFTDDSVVFPAISRNGSVIVFRHLFDLYSFRPGKDKTPKKIKITYSGDEHRKPTLHRTLKKATDVAFSHDGLDVAFIAGGDVWVMDTELREPKQVTDTAEEERDLVFSPNNDALLFVSDKEQQSDIWSATRDNSDQYWWQNDTFSLRKLTDDSDVEGSISWSPTGDQVAFVKSPGDLWVMKPDGTGARRVIESWNAPDYDWSPDGKWFVYSVRDNNFNSEVFIAPIDGSREPFNLSMHPRDDKSPVWSPDGSRIAFTGNRIAKEVDVYYVFLQKAKEDESSRDRKLEKALEKMKKARKRSKNDPDDGKSKKRETGEKQDEEKEQPDQEKKDEKGSEEKEDDKSKVEPVVIDFDGLRDRIHRIAVLNSRESHLFWSHDSKKLAFIATVEGKRGTYTVEFPSNLKPKLLTSRTGTNAKWIKPGNQILWLSGGVPTSFSASNGKTALYQFSARQATDVATRYETTFMQCWRYMRDSFYDARLNNRNWDAIYRKYASTAREAIDPSALADVVSLMLGELNASHLGFRPRSSGSSASNDWHDTTAHLGLRFDPRHNGPGLKVRDVILDGAADKAGSRISAGEVVLSVDGQDVDPAMDLTKVLNGPLERDITLRVENAEGQEREVAIRPMSYENARRGLYEMWIRHNRDVVDEASNGRLGYLHIRAMNMGSFYRFEQELYKIGCGKDGLVIDVRENGGGATTDHLLTALTQPDHAITVPREGGPGYPHDRRVYATWKKPIVVLCNQNSFSNAEIFSHAIKTLKRGRLVGVPTSGSVISTGSTSVMDMGHLRIPFRGWFLLKTGADMELNGAAPHVTLWPMPGEIPTGKDRQLEKAVKMLENDVKRWKKRKQPELQTAAEKRATSQ
ncbi:MAG: S41 family peptidase [Planctomycetota bacterium]